MNDKAKGLGQAHRFVKSVSLHEKEGLAAVAIA